MRTWGNVATVRLRVLTLNLRYGTAPDGEFAWPHRRSRLIERLQAADADIIATQEGLTDQLAEIQAALPGYQRIGVGREDGREQGEHVAIFFRPPLVPSASGHFWLSDEPTVPNSRSYCNSLTRMATWVEFANPTWTLVNTHLDHESHPSRLASIDQIVSFVGDRPAIVTGDFNIAPNSDDFHSRYQSHLRDAQRGEPNGTFHGFSGTTDGDRIDYILHSAHFRVIRHQIDHSRPVSSDHDAVIADLERSA